jgi:hypothetical protein
LLWASVPRAVIALSVVFGVIGGASRSLAQSAAQAGPGAPLSSVLELSRGASCLDESALEARTGEWLAKHSLDPGLHIQVTGDAQNPRWVRFEITRSGVKLMERRFEPGPESCPQLHAVLALAIAIGVRASLLEELKLTPPDLPTHAPSGRFGLELAGVWSSGFGPGLGGGLELGLGFSLSPWAGLRVGLLGLRTAGGHFDGFAGTYAITTAALTLEGCLTGTGAKRLFLRACTGAAGGVLVGSGWGFPESQAAAAAHAAWLGRADAQVQLRGRLWFCLGFLLGVPLVKHAINLRDAHGGRVVQSERLATTGLAATVGMVLRL